MLSSTFPLSATRRKPAHCSKAFGPSFGTFFSAAREVKGPFSCRKITMFFATVALIPATRASSGTEAVFRSTPTELTQFSTTPSSASLRWAWGISC